ncbi:MAG TPA: nicotinate phosphoribosyltransferase [Syntrophales bacterium]|nr:nicotinate phosphoribosyltransferase [Syntrophales bacterium]
MGDLRNSPLLTDLYQFTMLQGYLRKGMRGRAAFEFFVRKLPPERNFLVAAGLDTLLDYLEAVRFTDDDLSSLSKAGNFSQELLDYLAGFRFRGDVFAVAEGMPVFENEPIVRVEADIKEGQLVETRLINLVHFQTLIASKAARCMLAAGEGTVLVDFGVRRAHAAEAGILAARAAYIGGFAGTSTVAAAVEFGIPVFGTMAHSFIEAQESESEAFLSFARANPSGATLLIDTYDTLKGAETAVRIAPQLAEEGISIRGVRLDSGDLESLSREVRKILDRGGLKEARIFASGNIDEYSILALHAAGAPIDGFGVGTRLDTSADAPYLDSAYKLVEYDGKPRFKKSEGKETYPGRKQVFRLLTGEKMQEDILTLAGDRQEGTPLIEKVMSGGRRISPAKGLDEIARCCREKIRFLPDRLKSLDAASPYPVRISRSLLELYEASRRILQSPPSPDTARE